MGTVNVTLGEDTRLNLILGQQDENEVREVVFDFSGWYATYGSGTISLSVQRSKDQWPYEVELTVDNTNHTATWTITDTDTGYAGVGMVQITYTVGTAKKKSVVYRFTVYKSLGATGNVITPVQLQTWMDEVDQEITDIKQDLSDLEDRVEVLEEGGGGSGLTDDIKQALYDCISHIGAWTDEHGQDYVDALYDALYPPAPPATLTSITCVYTQSGTVYDTDTLDSLKSDLVVTAHYDNGTSQTVTAYTLSGTLEEGTSTITVSYNGKTTTFTVIVTANTVITGYTSIGTPNISGNEFTPSADGYIKTTEVFSPGDSSWAIRLKVARSTTAGRNFENLYRAVDASNTAKRATFIQALADAHKLYISSDDSSNDIMNAQIVTINNGDVKYIEIAFDGNQTYTAKTSTDGETWTTELTQESSSKIYSGDYIAFGGPNSGATPYEGIIYMDTIKIYIDGDLWWQATA